MVNLTSNFLPYIHFNKELLVYICLIKSTSVFQNKKKTKINKNCLDCSITIIFACLPFTFI